MRVLLDANIFISFLLHPRRQSPSALLVRSAVAGRFTLLLPEALLQEFTGRAQNKPYLAGRITPDDIRTLAAVLADVAETVPAITQRIPAVTRDPKDDYLLAYAVVGEAGFLITGDEDLLALGQVGTMQIMTPRAFLEWLDSEASPV